MPKATDWERVKREAAQDAPVAHNTVADGPYDPNDAAAVVNYWQQASINTELRDAMAHEPTKP
jgi:hypothetical protein